MSTYVLMRILESAPSRYDIGIRVLTLGRLAKVYDRLASHIEPGRRVLDIGCGTGAFALRAARRGANVKGIDVNPEMLEIARQRVRKERLPGHVELSETGVAELDEEAPESYDAVTSGLCFSELGDDELDYTLRQIVRILKPGGLLLVADEAAPRGRVFRLAHQLTRWPFAAVAYLVAGQTTRPVVDLPSRVTGFGLTVTRANWIGMGAFLELVARKPVGRR